MFFALSIALLCLAPFVAADVVDPAFVGLAPNGSMVVQPPTGAELLLGGTSMNALLERIGALETLLQPKCSLVSDTSTFPVSEGLYKWFGGFLARSGKIYGLPSRAAAVLVADPMLKTVDTTSLAVKGQPAIDRHYWCSGAMGADGKIYAAPFDDDAVLVVDPATNATASDTSPFRLTGARRNKYCGGVLARDNKIYFVPSTAQDVMVIDPSSNSTNIIPGVKAGADKWFGGVLSEDGRIFCLPGSDPSVHHRPPRKQRVVLYHRAFCHQPTPTRRRAIA